MLNDIAASHGGCLDGECNKWPSPYVEAKLTANGYRCLLIPMPKAATRRTGGICRLVAKDDHIDGLRGRGKLASNARPERVTHEVGKPVSLGIPSRIRLLVPGCERGCS